MMQGSLAWNWRTDILCFHLLFYLSALRSSITSSVSHSLKSSDTVLLFPLFFHAQLLVIIALSGADDWSNILSWHLKTCMSASGRLNLCDWRRETFLWHATKICPGEWVIKGFWERTVSKNEYQHKRTQHRQRFSGSPCPGSYSQRQPFKHRFAWLYFSNNVFVWTNRIDLDYEECIPASICFK